MKIDDIVYSWVVYCPFKYIDMKIDDEMYSTLYMYCILLYQQQLSAGPQSITIIRGA